MIVCALVPIVDLAGSTGPGPTTAAPEDAAPTAAVARIETARNASGRRPDRCCLRGDFIVTPIVGRKSRCRPAGRRSLAAAAGECLKVTQCA